MSNSDRTSSHRLVRFDQHARDLVNEMVDAGWSLRITKKGEAFLKAPDGSTTTTVSRSSLRGRSGANARAFFERWKKGQLDG